MPKIGFNFDIRLPRNVNKTNPLPLISIEVIPERPMALFYRRF